MKVERIKETVRLDLETEQEFEAVLAALDMLARSDNSPHHQLADDIADALAEKGDL